MFDDISILIPTYNPHDSLLKEIDLLKKNGFSNIFLVDDGSVDKSIFSKVNVSEIITYESNKGKGYALKTGFKYINDLNFNGVITVDDDLQQDISDIVKIAKAFKNKNGVYIGERNFNGAPVLRKLGNNFSSFLFKKIYGVCVNDTQTGLRCFPKDLFLPLCEVGGNRFEYEMNVLKFLVKENIPINRVDIKTIYNDNGSHYNIFRDSFNIFMNIINKNNF